MKHALTAVALTMATSAAADCGPYVALHGVSKHFGATREFNELNFGAGVGVKCGETWRAGLEGGAFINSYDDWSTYVDATFDVRVVDQPSWDLYVGVSTAFVEYPNLVSYAQNLGMPVIGDHVLIPALAIEVAFEKISYSTHIVVGGAKFEVLATASVHF